MTTVMTLPNYMTGFLHELGPSSGVYSFVSYPAAILPTNRPKYRNEAAVNIMHDRRVVRGNTYAQKIPLRNMRVTPTSDAVTAEIRQREAERRSYIRRRGLPTLDGSVKLTTSHNGKMTELSKPQPVILNGDSTPDAKQLAARARARKRISGVYGSHRDDTVPLPVEGRKHCQIQTDEWLHEIQDRVPETEIGVQTDKEIWPPVSRPTIVTDNSGVDKSTQILPDDPDLFVFDDEVVIVLEALVGKTLEQGLLEVIDEEEVATMTQQKLSHQHRAMLTQFS